MSKSVYVPPYLRNKASSASETLDSGDRSQKEIHAYFWKNSLDTFDSYNSSTLHSSKDNPDGLGYVLLFQRANPLWQTEKTIFAKSNLDLLPALQQSTVIPTSPTSSSPPGPGSETALPPTASITGTSAEHPPFAVFEQVRKQSTHDDRVFNFVGWFRIARLDLLQPRSEALVAMLQRKWKLKNKDGEVIEQLRSTKAWEESLRHKWAVIKMELDDEAMKELGPPHIEKIEKERKGSVNEMLRKLRQGEGEKKKTADEGGVAL